MVELTKEQIQDLEQKALEINIASEAILDMVQLFRYGELNKKEPQKEPEFWKKIEGIKNDRIKRVAKKSNE